MPPRGRSETPEQIATDLNISDFDQTNERDRMFVGIISKLRSKNRELQGSVDTLTAANSDLESEVTDFRRTSKESDIISSVLGDKLVIKDQAKFDRWKAKLTDPDSWEEDLKQLVQDFSEEKSDGGDKGGKKPAGQGQKKDAGENKGGDDDKGKGAGDDKNKGGEDDKGKGAGDNKPGYQTRSFKGGGGTQELSGTGIRAPRTPSERLRFANEDPEGYDAWRAENQGR